ncbi:MAG: helix-turn-helix transcriptional regulator, partial [Lachnospiraceae bacterium]|nr:helix-turn-helix transcriptional regulator [Lachnospiraceae bacterium]
MIISERIFKLIEERGMTQIAFSRETGISQSTISDWK